MLTGRENYTDFKKFHKEIYGEDLDFISSPELVLSHAKYSTRAAIFYWYTKKVYTAADAGITDGAIRKVTIAINGGTNGLSERTTFTKDIYKRRVFKNICFNKSKQDSNAKCRDPK